MTSSNDSSRLDRIETLLESIAQRQERFTQNLEQLDIRIDSIAQSQERFTQNLEQLDDRINSNAKAIEALSNERKQIERELSRDRARLYQTMADLASAQASFYGRLAEVDRRQDELSHRQGEIVEILKRITQQPPQ